MDAKINYIGLEELKTYFEHIFNEPRTTEVAYLENEEYWKLKFCSSGFVWIAIVWKKALTEELKKEMQGKDLTSEDVQTAFEKFKDRYLRYAIPYHEAK